MAQEGFLVVKDVFAVGHHSSSWGGDMSNVAPRTNSKPRAVAIWPN